MNDQKHQDGALLATLFHHRWNLPALAALEARGGGAKFITLQRALDVSRDSLKRTLAALDEAGWVERNPGYGHPMRPEYILTAAGKRLGSRGSHLLDRLRRLRLEDVALRKWSIPVVAALARVDGRFNRIRDALDTATPRALAAALRDLQTAGVVERYLVDDDPPRTEYQLTRMGHNLAAAVRALSEP